MLGETWPVTTSPATGHPAATHRIEGDWFLRIDVEEILDAIQQPLIDPPPLGDPALEDT